MTVKHMAGFLILITLCWASIGPARAADAPGLPLQLKDVKVEQRPAGVTVTLSTTGQPKYQAVLIDAPTRLVIDMSGTYAAPRVRWTPLPEPIKEIRGSQ